MAGLAIGERQVQRLRWFGSWCLWERGGHCRGRCGNRSVNPRRGRRSGSLRLFSGVRSACAFPSAADGSSASPALEDQGPKSHFISLVSHSWICPGFYHRHPATHNPGNYVFQWDWLENREEASWEFVSACRQKMNQAFVQKVFQRKEISLSVGDRLLFAQIAVPGRNIEAFSLSCQHIEWQTGLITCRSILFRYLPTRYDYFIHERQGKPEHPQAVYDVCSLLSFVGMEEVLLPLA